MTYITHTIQENEEMTYIIQNKNTKILLEYDGGKLVYLHALIRYSGKGHEGTCVSMTPDMLADLRDAIQGVLDAMGVEE